MFAARDLAAGERIDWAEAHRRHRVHGEDGHTFFFDLGDDVVIDGGAGGNSARWVNHGCEPNVEAVVTGGTVDFHAAADIAAGEELLLDYRLVLDDSAGEEERAAYGCRCAAARCRGSMLAG